MTMPELTLARARRVWPGVLLALLAGCLPVSQRPPQHLLEPFDAAVVPHDSSIIYEADVAPHLFLYDGLRDAYDRISQDDLSANVAWTARGILSPMFIVRQMHDSSAAVRTPSFMPRAAVEIVRVSRLGRPTLDPDIQFAGVRLLGARVSLAHHSNGQAGCFRNGFVPIDAHSKVCTWDGVSDTAVVTLNRASGDFSSTYVEGLVYGAWMNRGKSRVSTVGAGVALAGDLYPPGIFGDLSPEQAALYGRWRGRAVVESQWRPQSGIACHDPGSHSLLCLLAGQLYTRGEYVRAPVLKTPLARRLAEPMRPYRWSAELSYALDQLLGSGPFIRWEDGQDYYNIGFVNRRKEFLWGVTLAPGGPDRVSKKSALP
jgi:hypothetical protein